MSKINLRFTYLFVILVGMSSCVSKGKYIQSEQLNTLYQTEIDSLKAITAKVSDIPSSYEYQNIDKTINDANTDLAIIQEDYESLKRNYYDVLKKYDELIEQNQALLNVTSSDERTYRMEISKQQANIDDQAREIKRLKTTITGLRKSLSEQEPVIIKETAPAPPPRTIIKNDCTQYQNQINELNSLIAEKEDRLKNLRVNINRALNSFNDSDLTVTEFRGKIYVSMSQNLLFARNSDKIDWKGKKAIRSLAEVLNQNTDIDIMVEGHTDNSGNPDKNWSLSLNRANAVVKILTEAAVNPQRITASGRSFYLPVASNATAEGRAKNRRTEIILRPKLEELYNIINE